MQLNFLPILMLSLQPVLQHYSCEYITSDSKGHITSRRAIAGNLETNPHKQTWSGVKVTREASILPQGFMDGFTYDPGNPDLLKEPGVFKEFPSTAVEAKDIVSDLVELGKYAALASQAKPGVSFIKGVTAGDTALSGLGSADLKGRHCHILKFESFFNKVEFSVPEVRFVGRSHRWGELWVEQGSNVIVFATLKEDLLGELTIGKSKDSVIINILRKGTLELR